jgi:hypothetical protein
MGLFGSILGGALQGVGTGMQQDIINQRNMALEQMRQQFQTQLQDRGFQQQKEMAGINHGYHSDESAQTFEQQKGLLAAGGQIDLTKIKLTQYGQKDLARLESQLHDASTAAEIKLRDQMTNGDVLGIERTDTGELIGITKDGKPIHTGVIGAPTAAERDATGGGTLSESEQTSAYNDALDAWNAAGKTGEKPKASDFIGMTHRDYRRGTQPAGKQEAPSVSMSERKALYAQALTKAQSGDRRFKGLSQSQIQAKVDDRFAQSRVHPPELIHGGLHGRHSVARRYRSITVDRRHLAGRTAGFCPGSIPRSDRRRTQRPARNRGHANGEIAREAGARPRRQGAGSDALQGSVNAISRTARWCRVRPTIGFLARSAEHSRPEDMTRSKGLAVSSRRSSTS